MYSFSVKIGLHKHNYVKMSGFDVFEQLLYSKRVRFNH